MTTDQKNLIFSFFIKSQFTYCPLISMLCTKRSLCRIKNKHEWCLRLIQQNYRAEFERRLENANEKSVHQKYFKFLLIEVYKYLNGLSPDLMNTIFKLRQYTYNLRNFHAFESQDPRTKNFDLNSIAYRVSQPWKDVPREVPLISCLYLVYLNLAEYILVPHVQQNRYWGIPNATYNLIRVDIVLDYFLFSV